MTLQNGRIILVRPHVAANIGAAARAMRNFGLRDLIIVGPAADPLDREARRLSTHGEAILESARVMSDLGEAVADCVFVAATSARTGGLFHGEHDEEPEPVFAQLAAKLMAGPAALVFGPESSGLSNAEIGRCDALIHIPADPEYPALNLAQSVAVCLYELRRHWMRLEGTLQPPEPPAPYAEQEQMFAHLQRALTRIHFLYGEKADALMHAIRRLVARGGPTAMEVKLLHGLARQIEWVADRCAEGLDY